MVQVFWKADRTGLVTPSSVGCLFCTKFLPSFTETELQVGGFEEHGRRILQQHELDLEERD